MLWMVIKYYLVRQATKLMLTLGDLNSGVVHLAMDNGAQLIHNSVMANCAQTQNTVKGTFSKHWRIFIIMGSNRSDARIIDECE